MSKPHASTATPLRLLVGPYHFHEHWSYMRGAFDDYQVVTFGTGPEVDVPIRSTASIQDVLARLPDGFRPDLLLLWRPEYGAVPWGLEELDLPVVMLTSDWYLEFEICLEQARWVNLVVTGSRGEQVFQAAGIEHVLSMPMLGYEPGVDGVAPPAKRDIDVFHAGSANWAVHAEREHVLAELMELPESVEFKVRTLLSRKEYAAHLARSRIVINPTVIGEVNMRVYETCAAGACLFVEEDNLDVPQMLDPGREVVLYNRKNLREKVLYYLEHEDERAAIARRGQRRLQARTYRTQMRGIVERVTEIGLERVAQMGRPILATSPRDRLRRYAVTNLRYTFGDTAGLARRAAQGLRHGATLQDRGLLALLAYISQPDGESAGSSDLKSGARNPTLIQGVVRELSAVAQEGELAASWFNLAALCRKHATPESARNVLEGAIAHFQSLDSLPLGTGDFYALSADDARRARLERASWEAVEHGADPGAEVRRHLLSTLFGWQADLLLMMGDAQGGEAALVEAIAVDSLSFQGRFALAGILESTGREEEGIHVLREHVAVRPLDLPAHAALAQLEIRRGHFAAAAQTLRYLHRATDVFGDDQGRQCVELLLSKVESIPMSDIAAAAPAS